MIMKRVSHCYMDDSSTWYVGTRMTYFLAQSRLKQKTQVKNLLLFCAGFPHPHFPSCNCIPLGLYVLLHLVFLSDIFSCAYFFFNSFVIATLL